MPAGPTFRLPPTAPKEYTRPLIVASFAADPILALPPYKFSTLTFPVTSLTVAAPPTAVIVNAPCTLVFVPPSSLPVPPPVWYMFTLPLISPSCLIYPLGPEVTLPSTAPKPFIVPNATTLPGLPPPAVTGPPSVIDRELLTVKLPDNPC